MSEDKIVNGRQQSLQQPQSATATATGSTMVGLNLGIGGTGGVSTFHQRRLDLFKQLQGSIEQCCAAYENRRELASERDVLVADLCEALEEAFNYGLRQDVTMVNAATSLLHNMTEIIKGGGSLNGNANDSTFWDFCQTHLTKHERERYECLKHVWTKYGRGRAFIRTTLNENSLQRYILTWLSDVDTLRRYYTPWSLLLHDEVAVELPKVVGNLNKIVFALKADAIELNTPARNMPPTREEPIIYAPAPQPTNTAAKSKRKVTAVERPIISTEDVIAALQITAMTTPVTPSALEAYANVEVAEQILYNTVQPELEEFLKQPLDDFFPENHDEALLASSNVEENNTNAEVPLTNGDGMPPCEVSAEAEERAEEADEDTLSQYSKASSSAVNNNCSVLEEQLREMSVKYVLLETRVAQLTRENRQLVRRLTQLFNESGIDPSSSLATNYLITIPYVQLLKAKRSTAYYIYEIHITMRQNLEHWTVLRRYREFYKLHKSLKKTHPHIANMVEFPPKKHFGNMNAVFVEERRQQLQIYLLNVVEALPQVEACKSKADLQKTFPFLRER